MKITAEPRSDQWNADDFIGGPRTFTIAGVKAGTAEQKYDIALVEGEGRAWRPPLTVLRLLLAAWGDEAEAWVGRRVTLYRDAGIRFGPDAVGGIRVSHMSDLPGGKRFEVRLTSARGKKSLHTVEPLPDAPPPTPKPDLKGLAAAFKAASITDKAAMLDYCRRITGRALKSAADLTADECATVTDALAADAQDTEADDWAGESE